MVFAKEDLFFFFSLVFLMPLRFKLNVETRGKACLMTEWCMTDKFQVILTSC